MRRLKDALQAASYMIEGLEMIISTDPWVKEHLQGTT